MATTGAAGPELDFQARREQVERPDDRLPSGRCRDVASMRFRQVIAEENPHLEGFNGEAWRSSGLQTNAKFPGARNVRASRGENYEILKDLPEIHVRASGRHTEIGQVTLFDLLKINRSTRESCETGAGPRGHTRNTRPSRRLRNNSFKQRELWI